MIVIPDESLILLVDDLIGSIVPFVHLYQNDPPLTRRTALADLVELDVPGYSAQRAITWSPATIRGDQAVSEADPIRFTRGAGGTPRDVYGYFVTDSRDGPLLWAERGAGAPCPMRALGQTLLVIARFSLGPCAPGPILAGGDLGMGGVGSLGVPLIAGLGELGLAGESLSAPILGAGEVVMDGSGAFGEPPILGAGEVVMDGSGAFGEPPILGAGEVVTDGSGLLQQYYILGLGDLGGDGTSQQGPSPILGLGPMEWDGDGNFF